MTTKLDIPGHAGLLVLAADPPLVAGQALLYVKLDGSGVAQLFSRNSAGLVTQITPSVTPTSLSLPWSDGIYGDIVLNGGAAPTGMTGPVGSVYTMTRDCLARTLVIDPGFTLITAGWRVLASVSVTINGVLHNNGTDGTAGLPGAAGVGGLGGYFNAGSNGGAGNGGVGATSATFEPAPYGSSSSTALGGAATVAGLPGNVVARGGGGGGGGAGAGGNGGPITVTSIADGPPHVFNLLKGARDLVTTEWTSGSGGGGGGSAGSGAGGGGGGAGGRVFVGAPNISGTGIASANGGNGGDGTLDGGGGGGGGGGSIGLVGVVDLTGGLTVTATGGTGGAVTGAGAAGGDGADGVVHVCSAI